MPAATEKMALKLTPSQKRALDREAKRRGVSRRHLVRELLAVALGVPNDAPHNAFPAPYYSSSLGACGNRAR